MFHPDWKFASELHITLHLHSCLKLLGPVKKHLANNRAPIPEGFNVQQYCSQTLRTCTIVNCVGLGEELDLALLNKAC
jgi:hypothetical protein